MELYAIPAYFSHGDMALWLHRFDTCATANKWGEAEQLLRLPTFLEGFAFHLYRRLQPSERDSMQNLRANLLNLFYPPENRDLRQLELSRMKCLPNEHIDEFVYRLESKFAQAYPFMHDDALANQRAEMLKAFFIAGLPEHHQTRLRQITQLTYSQAQVHARQLKALDTYEAVRKAQFSMRLAAVESQVAALILSRNGTCGQCDNAVVLEPEVENLAFRLNYQVESASELSNTARSSACLTAMMLRVYRFRSVSPKRNRSMIRD